MTSIITEGDNPTRLIGRDEDWDGRRLDESTDLTHANTLTIASGPSIQIVHPRVISSPSRTALAPWSTVGFTPTKGDLVALVCSENSTKKEVLRAVACITNCGNTTAQPVTIHFPRADADATSIILLGGRESTAGARSVTQLTFDRHHYNMYARVRVLEDDKFEVVDPRGSKVEHFTAVVDPRTGEESLRPRSVLFT